MFRPRVRRPERVRVKPAVAKRLVKRTMRKLQHWSSSGCYAISLPVDWVRRMNLQEGEYVEIIEDELGRLIIIPRTKLEIEQHLLRMGEEIERLARPPGQAPSSPPPPPPPPPGQASR